MFIVEPFEKGPSIRSSLGFMSLTSRWGSLMFPGITVLNRDFHDIWAIHRVIKRFKDEGRSLNYLKTKDADDLYAAELKKILEFDGSKDKFKQQMSYWQRYGSFVEYFDLFGATKVPSDIKSYRNIVFLDEDPKVGQPNDIPTKDIFAEKRRLSRAVRIENSNWYGSFRNDLVSNSLLPETSNDILNNENKLWWITGLEKPSRLRVPQIVILSRQLEFSLTVWQTLFEAAGILLHKGLRIPKAGQKNMHAVARFLNLFALKQSGVATDESLFELVQMCLDIHETILKKSTTLKWEKEFQSWIEKKYPGTSHKRFVVCHKPEFDIPKISALDSKYLLDALAAVHVYYCELQKKPASILVKKFSAKDPGEKVPDISAIFGGGRWGLFGYRLEASWALNRSEKYKDIHE